MKYILTLVITIMAWNLLTTKVSAATTPWWQIQSVDDMKYSRDLAKEKLNDPSFDAVIDQQMKNIADTGATHVGIGTPYDEEFVPILTRWVTAARKYNLHVWFRGNFSGWEGWFNYPSITREQHIQMSQAFIMKHPDLFEDGDMFSACPECENGGPGDPRLTGDVDGHRQFLIKEYSATRDAFNKIGKDVMTNMMSMNGDVATLIMNESTTKSLGGIMTVDHYVSTPEKLLSDVQGFAKRSDGKVFLGEFGAPIPDINGNMNEDQQAAWIDQALTKLQTEPSLLGINYWVSQGGSTQLWNDDGTPRKAVAVIQKHFKPRAISGKISKQYGKALQGVTVASKYRSVQTHADGQFVIPVLSDETSLTIMDSGYLPQTVTFDDSNVVSVSLVPDHPSVIDRIVIFFHQLHW